MDDKMCYKKFKEITKSDGNDKYLYWKNWIEDELVSYNQNQIINLLKNYQIKYEIMEKKEEPKAISIFVPLSSIFITFMTIIVTLFVLLINNLLSASSKFSVFKSQEEYMNLVSDTLMNGIESSISIVVNIALIVIGLIFLAYLMDYWRQNYYARRCVYFFEVINVLQEILEKRKENEGKNRCVENHIIETNTYSTV